MLRRVDQLASRVVSKMEEGIVSLFGVQFDSGAKFLIYRKSVTNFEMKIKKCTSKFWKFEDFFLSL